MKNARTSWKLAVLLLLVLVKESAWIMWIPAGASPVEIAHYRIAEIRGTKQGSEMRGLPAIRKELVEIERYALIGDNGLPIRGSDDRARLDGVLSRDGSAYTTARTKGYSLSNSDCPGYYILLSRAQKLLSMLEIQWRWNVLRFGNTICLLFAAWFTFLAAQRLIGSSVLFPLASALIVGFGPWSGPGGALLGPGALSAALLGAWVWHLVLLVRGGDPWNLTWAALISLALSSVGGDGMGAVVGTAVVLVVVHLKDLISFRKAPFYTCCVLLILGFGLWIFRLSMGFHSPGHEGSWTAFFFASQGLIEAPIPGWIAWIWRGIAVLAVSGLIKTTMRREFKMTALLVPLVAVFIFVVFACLSPWRNMSLVSISPVVALICGAGLAAWAGKGTAVWVGVALLMVLAEWGGLLMWAIPWLYQ